MFIKHFEELTPAEADAIVDLELNADTELEDMVASAVDGLYKVKELIAPGCVLDGVEKPDAGKIREAVRDVVEKYQVAKNLSREKVHKRVKVKQERKKEQKEKEKNDNLGARKETEERKGKSPRYYGLVPELDARSVLDVVFSQQSANASRTEEGAEFWEKLKKGKRVTEQPHITIVHQKQLPDNQDVWDKSVSVNALRTSPAFECELGRVLWDGRVMALVVDDLRLSPSVSGEEEGKEGKAFVDALPKETRDRLHVTIGTANGGIMPVEGKVLVERWRAGEREDKGVFGVEFEGGGVVVNGKLRGLWA